MLEYCESKTGKPKIGIMECWNSGTDRWNTGRTEYWVSAKKFIEKSQALWNKYQDGAEKYQ